MPARQLDRRRMLIGTTASLVAAPGALAQRTLIVTPGQTEGPFYPVSFPADMDADLVRVQGLQAQAMGQITHVTGRVLNKRGDIVRGAQVEIWQCDANGIYNHPRQPGAQRRDAAFQGYGRTEVTSEGRYAFRTIKPVPYPGRTPHIHFKVSVPGTGRLTTQLYIAGEPRNASDGVLNSIRNAKARESLIVPFAPAGEIEPDALKANFDIVLDV
jgi:protocatechuate 3,4-dioxygenase, beta subunit